MKKNVIIIPFLFVTILSAQTTRPYLLKRDLDYKDIKLLNNYYSTRYIIKKYDIGSYGKSGNEKQDHKNPDMCLWTITIPIQNEVIHSKIGAIRFYEIKDDCKMRKYRAKDLIINWYADSTLFGKEFIFARSKRCKIQYNTELLPKKQLQDKLKQTEIDDLKNRIFKPENYKNEPKQNIRSEGHIDTLFDCRDGNTYKTIKIGNQIWMAENLAYEDGYYTIANNKDQNYIKKYGYLYSWNAAKSACPQGYHLPTKAEFETLLDNYGGGKNFNNKNYKALISGGASGFSALLGGYMSYDYFGYFGYIGDIGNSGDFWTATGIERDSQWAFFMSNYYNAAGMYNYPNCGWFFSIRCVKDSR